MRKTFPTKRRRQFILERGWVHTIRGKSMAVPTVSLSSALERRAFTVQ